jgi:hypothetical protein
MKDITPTFINGSPGGGVSPSSLAPYELLMRPSQKLGAVATRAFGDIKGLLHRDVVIPSAIRNYYTRSSELQRLAELKRVVQKSHEVLAQAQNITIFPDEVIVDRSKVTIIKRTSPWAHNTISIQIEDVLNVSTQLGMFFGTLTISSRVMNTIDHYDVNLLWRRDAIELKHIIQGYSIAKHNGVDVSELTLEETVETLRELGVSG